MFSPPAGRPTGLGPRLMCSVEQHARGPVKTGHLLDRQTRGRQRLRQVNFRRNPARLRPTSNSVTARNAVRPARKPSALAFQPNPSVVTMPAPVMTTRFVDLWGEGNSTGLGGSAHAGGERLRWPARMARAVASLRNNSITARPPPRLRKRSAPNTCKSAWGAPTIPVGRARGKLLKPQRFRPRSIPAQRSTRA